MTYETKYSPELLRAGYYLSHIEQIPQAKVLDILEQHFDIEIPEGSASRVCNHYARQFSDPEFVNKLVSQPWVDNLEAQRAVGLDFDEFKPVVEGKADLDIDQIHGLLQCVYEGDMHEILDATGFIAEESARQEDFEAQVETEQAETIDPLDTLASDMINGVTELLNTEIESASLPSHLIFNGDSELSLPEIVERGQGIQAELKQRILAKLSAEMNV